MTDQELTGATLYWLSTTLYWLSITKCPVYIQYTASLPRNEQLSQLDLVLSACAFDNI